MLASVPGTVAAQEALLKAQIPTTATIKRSAAKLTVVYSGPPRFVPLPGTTMLYAVNTNSYVLQIGTAFYACEGGAWFVAATPTGPWLLADSVPAVIRTIPPTSPLYTVTYVQVYAVNARRGDLRIHRRLHARLRELRSARLRYRLLLSARDHCRAGADLLSLSVHLCRRSLVQPQSGAWARGGIVYGPYGGVATGGSYYNPSTGAWAHGGAVYGPNGGAGAWSAYNPSTGSYAHGSASWSNGSGSANASYYNARTGVSGSTNQNENPYGRWGSSSFSGPNQTVNTQSGANANGRAGSFNSSTGAKGAGYQNSVTGEVAASSKRKMAMCMLDTTATSTNTPTAVGRNTTRGPGTRCSRRRETALNKPISSGQQQFPRQHAARPTAARGLEPWIEATTSNWNRIVLGGRPAAAAGAVPAMPARASSRSRQR